MTWVPNGKGMLVETRYVPGGKYTIAFFVVEPWHFAPQRLPEFKASLVALVSSYYLLGFCMHLWNT